MGSLSQLAQGLVVTFRLTITLAMCRLKVDAQEECLRHYGISACGARLEHGSSGMHMTAKIFEL
jgi:hypothetical protein